ncbi:spermidine/putrescine ABC transporter permease PotB [Psychrosphaera aquimarina]|uniref:Spermidine/putrescine ABC transporter permease PotB n=1 Tax=Psychrosphaera aquimarina TaxID=2044854 RepID=A0ABU3QVK2_9GAMM|nr:spermidine/putrescine ABC transporter permease PotB [Psychrosphaera aquimarina]MDU0111465.1 spermidine/putrescine ABC transporter permease PotB [Psychrosphaera aquimarina]
MNRYSSPLNFRRLVITLTLTWLGLFVLLPHLMVILTSVLTPDAEHLVIWPITFDNYLKVFEPIYAGVFWNSLLMSGITTLVCLLIGYPFAYLLANMSPTMRVVLLFLMVVPFWTNSLIRIYAIKMILGKKGIVNSFLMFTDVIDSPVQLIYTDFAVIIGLVYILLPFMVLPLIASFAKLDTSLIEVGKDLGASPFYRFIHILLPLTAPGIIAGCLIVFLPAMGMFYVADILGGAKSLLLGNVIKNQFLVVRDWPFGSAFSVFLILLMAGLLIIYNKANNYIQYKGGLDDENL